jgi:hypothetical protein
MWLLWECITTNDVSWLLRCAWSAQQTAAETKQDPANTGAHNDADSTGKAKAKLPQQAR